jgi:small subunit ribosomal protein S13
MVCCVISKKLLLKTTKQGLGYTSGAKILAILGFSGNQKFSNFSIKDTADFNTISHYVLRNVDINDIKLNNVELLQNLSTYRGKKHSLKMPVRGQKTRTNASTRKKFNVI